MIENSALRAAPAFSFTVMSREYLLLPSSLFFQLHQSYRPTTEGFAEALMPIVSFPPAALNSSFSSVNSRGIFSAGTGAGFSSQALRKTRGSAASILFRNFICLVILKIAYL